MAKIRLMIGPGGLLLVLSKLFAVITPGGGGFGKMVNN
jgi:hypothetical protein